MTASIRADIAQTCRCCTQMCNRSSIQATPQGFRGLVCASAYLSQAPPRKLVCCVKKGRRLQAKRQLLQGHTSLPRVAAHTLLRAMSASTGEILKRLEASHGKQRPCWPTDPYLFLVWWHCGYPARRWRLCERLGVSDGERRCRLATDPCGNGCRRFWQRLAQGTLGTSSAGSEIAQTRHD